MSNSLTYKDAGVDIVAGDTFVNLIKPLIKRTRRPEMMGELGGFGGLFALPTGYQSPVLVAATDGVGTKLRLAIESQQHDTIGIDLVAMCVNDLVVQGAEPLFFLDYFASGKLSVETGHAIMKGITEGCVQAGAALIGGETAEMPGMYHGDDYDLAGFSVGIVEKSKVLDGSLPKAGDVLIGLASSGPHSNGYSLIRKIVASTGASLSEAFEESTLLAHLLAPTRIYVKSLLALCKVGAMQAAAHITGGGLTENLPRVFGEHLQARIDLSSWQRPAIFDWLQKGGQIAQDEMLKTFNCGIGMVVIVSPERLNEALSLLQTMGESACVIGSLKARETNAPSVHFEGKL